MMADRGSELSRGKSCRFAIGRGWPPGLLGAVELVFGWQEVAAQRRALLALDERLLKTPALRAPMRSARRAGRFGTRRRRGGGLAMMQPEAGAPGGVAVLSKGRARNPAPGRERKP